MNIDLQKTLLNRYVKFFRSSADMRPFDERGFECEDGWFEIIDQLSSACETEIEALVADGLDKSQWPRVSQIKEKFGSLRFRATGVVSAELREKFSHAEVASLHTCEKCGAPGRLRKEVGIQTYCDTCQIEYHASLSTKTNGFSIDFWDAYLQHCELIRTMLASRGG